MSDDKIVHLSSIREKRETQPTADLSNELTETMDEVLQPSDLAGFLRVVEVLRTMGDKIIIVASPDDVNIRCTQHMREDTGEPYTKMSLLSQETAFAFDYNAMFDDYPTFDDYVIAAAETMRESIISLHVWGGVNGAVVDTDLPEDYETLKQQIGALTALVKERDEVE